ncbi:glycosyltransferase family 4 protein [Candidatus Daviesbacteria bacterium]|nr:glycosyltransferase family 4 protein [Candidatus Daviesbacteria bacterium]
MTKVLMFGWEFPPFNSGGLGVACYGLSKALSQKNFQITFVLPKKVPIESNFIKIIFADSTNLDIKFMSGYITADDHKQKKALGFDGDLFSQVYKYGLLAREIAKSTEFDLIHAHDWLTFQAGIEAKRVSKKPLIVHVHATEFDRTGGKNINPRVYEIEKIGLESADKIIAVSNFTKKIITEQYEISPDKIKVIHNGVEKVEHIENKSELDLSKLKQNGAKIVLFVGRITLQKGVDYFLKAAQKVLQFYPKVYFIIAGSGDMEGQIIQQTASLGISDKVFFVGFLRGEMLAKIYQAADLFIMPSVSEPFGISTLESLAYGTPVLISKQSGVSEILSHALKTDFWDVDEMVNKILAVLNFNSLKSCLASNGQKQAMQFTWNKAANECIELYKEVLLNSYA